MKPDVVLRRIPPRAVRAIINASESITTSCPFSVSRLPGLLRLTGINTRPVIPAQAISTERQSGRLSPVRYAEYTPSPLESPAHPIRLHLVTDWSVTIIKKPIRMSSTKIYRVKRYFVPSWSTTSDTFSAQPTGMRCVRELLTIARVFSGRRRSNDRRK